MNVSSRRANCPGYLEFIYADIELPDIEPDVSRRVIAYITDVYSTPRKPWYCGVYGIHVVEANSVAAVKSALFALIEDGQ